MSPEAESPNCRPLLTMTDRESAAGWRSVNDNVMGGRSLGAAKFQDGQLRFSGAINTNGGGFASIRHALPRGALAGGNAVRLNMLPDDRTYQVSFQTSERSWGRPVAYRVDIRNPAPGEWVEPTVFFSELQATVFGRRVRSTPFDPADARTISIFIADGVDGEFELALKSIEVCSL
ncbi:MAG: CIA30 family protein [Pseudomonadota bacterium]